MFVDSTVVVSDSSVAVTSSVKSVLDNVNNGLPPTQLAGLIVGSILGFLILCCFLMLFIFGILIRKGRKSGIYHFEVRMK